MGSASRAALHRARAALREPLDRSTGAELLSAAAQIDRAPALRAALAESSASAASRTELVERLFGALSAGARSLLGSAVAEPWSSPSELVDGIEELGLRAEAIATPGLADELLAVAAAIDGSHELELSIGNKLGDPARKAALVERLFSGRLSDAALAIVDHLVSNPRGRRVSAALRAAAATAADEGGTELATVAAASPLSAEQQDRLTRLLERSAGRPVQVTTVIDPSLVGGVRIQLGDHIIDGSVRSRLDDLRLQLAG